MIKRGIRFIETFFAKHALKEYWIPLGSVLLVNKLLNVYYLKWMVKGKAFFLTDYLGGHECCKNFTSVYHTASFIFSSLDNVYFSVPILFLTFFLFINRKKNQWMSLDEQLRKPTYIFVIFISAFSTWFYALSHYNFFLNSYFVFDRALLAILFVLLLRNTWLFPAFVYCITLWFMQFSYPLEQNSINDKKIIYEILIVFISFLCVNSYSKRGLWLFWVPVFALIGSNYLYPAVAKIQISPSITTWVLENDLSAHTVFAYDRGWFSWLSDSARQNTLHFFSKYTQVICSLTMVIEVGAVLLFVNRKLAIVLLFCFCCFHLGVFLESGIFFWKWISFNTALIFLLIVFKENFKPLFNGRFLVVGTFLICSAEYFFNPVKLGWWDYRYKNGFDYYVEDVTGKTFRISGSQIKPYEQTFTFQRLFYLVPDSVPIIDYFKLGYNGFHYLNNVTDTNEVRALLCNSTYKPFDHQKQAVFDDFCTKYFTNFNTAIKKENIAQLVDLTPEHIWVTKFLPNQFNGKTTVKRFWVVFRQGFYLEEKLYILSSDKIFEKKLNNY